MELAGSTKHVLVECSCCFPLLLWNPAVFKCVIYSSEHGIESGGFNASGLYHRKYEACVAVPAEYSGSSD